MALPKKPITAAQMAAAEAFISGRSQEQPHTTLPKPKNEEKEQNVEPVETVEVKEEIVEEVKDEPNIIKVKRDTDEVKGDSSMKLSVKRKDDSMKMVVNEVNDNSSESVMEKMFKQMPSNENQE